MEIGETGERNSTQAVLRDTDQSRSLFPIIHARKLSCFSFIIGDNINV